MARSLIALAFALSPIAATAASVFPSGTPDYVKIYPGGRIIYTLPGATDRNIGIHYTSTAPMDQIAAFYNRDALAAGLERQPDKGPSLADIRMILYFIPDHHGFLNIDLARRTDGLTQVNLLYSRH